MSGKFARPDSNLMKPAARRTSSRVGMDPACHSYRYAPVVNSVTERADAVDIHRAQKAAKWIVYSLLLANFLYYLYEDLTRSAYTLTAQSTLSDWTVGFTASIDVFAWLLLLAMFELETYAVDEADWTRRLAKTVRFIRLLCYAMIAHTVYGYTVSLMQLQPTVAVDNVASLCDLAATDISYVYNLEYFEIASENCRELSDATRFFRVGNDPVVSSLDGLNLERKLAWADLVEILTWLIIIATMEIVVRLQGKGITRGATYSAAIRLKVFMYLILLGLAAYWAWLSHWLYTWDMFVWVAGFAAIEINISHWRDVLKDYPGSLQASGGQP